MLKFENYSDYLMVNVIKQKENAHEHHKKKNFDSFFLLRSQTENVKELEHLQYNHQINVARASSKTNIHAK